MATASSEVLAIADGFRLNVSTMFASGTVPRRISIIKCDATAGAFTATLPVASLNTGQYFLIKKTDSSANAVTVAGDTTLPDLIDGKASVALTSQYEAITLYSDGTNWMNATPVASGVFDSIVINQPADVTSGAPVAAESIIAGAHTGVLLEQNDLNVNLARTVTFADGSALATQRAMLIQAPTYASSIAKTITAAATVAISGAPVQGANVTLTNTYALWVQGGSSRFDGTSPILLPDTTGFNNGIQFGGAQKIAYDAANSTGLRNGTTSQTFSVYNTFTAGTPDYDRLEFTWSSNVAVIRTAANGAGTARVLDLRYGGTTNPAIRIGTSTNGGVLVGSTNTATAHSSGVFSVGSGATYSALSGTSITSLVNPTYSDAGTTSTTVVNAFNLSPTINFTAASKTGKVVLAYFNPTLTSQPTGNNAGISFSSAFTSSTFPAMRFHNVADEDTNWEHFEQGWHVTANTFIMRTNKGGTGTVRSFVLCYGGTSTSALTIPLNTSTAVDVGGGGAVASAIPNGRVSIGRAATITAASGTHNGLNVADSPAPTSTSTLVFRGVIIQPTINYSNATPGAGSVYGLYVAPVNTALPTGINAGIALSSTASGLTGAVLFFNQADETTNFEYCALGFVSNDFSIATVKGGTGTVRNILLNPGTADIKWGKALVALGGGAGATLGTIGGSGPASAAQNTWLRVLDSTGAACWLAAWK